MNELKIGTDSKNYIKTQGFRAKCLMEESIAYLAFMESALCSMELEINDWEENIIRGMAVGLSQQLIKLKEIDSTLEKIIGE